MKRLFKEDLVTELNRNEINLEEGFVYDLKIKIGMTEKRKEVTLNEDGSTSTTLYPSEPIYEDVDVYHEYTTQDKINSFKAKLADTDYKAIQFVEGEITSEEFGPTAQQRKQWRNELRNLLNVLQGE